MPQLDWTRDLAVGVHDLDYQLEELVDRITLLHEVQYDLYEDVTRKTLLFLDEYVTRHFHTEEAYMRKYDYPQTELHMGEHADFKENLNRLKLDFARRGTSPMYVDLLKNNLTKWLYNHIAKRDLELGRLVKAAIDKSAVHRREELSTPALQPIDLTITERNVNSY
jgi:hemerythrin-like metal-binding protein